MATPINLASASPVVINAWCKSIKVDSLIDLFKSNKIEPTPMSSVPCDLPRTVNGTGHTGPSEFCATSI